MASPARVDKMITLEEFLRMPEIDEHPYLEYIDGRIEAKVSPQKKHGLLEKRLMTISMPMPSRVGWVRHFRSCAARSPVDRSFPDVVFLLDEHIETDERGEFSTRHSDRRTSTSRSSRRTNRSGSAARNWSFPRPTAARSAG